MPPIARAPAVMSNCDDFNPLSKDSVNEVERKLQENESPPAAARSRVTFWILRDPLNGVLNLTNEFSRRTAASLKVPVRRR
jgi:hypothetical protein